MKIWFHRSDPNVPLHDVRVLEYDLGVVRSWIRGVLAQTVDPLLVGDPIEETIDRAFRSMLDGFLAAAAAASDDNLALVIAAGRSIEITEGNPPMQIEVRGEHDNQS